MMFYYRIMLMKVTLFKRRLKILAEGKKQIPHYSDSLIAGKGLKPEGENYNRKADICVYLNSESCAQLVKANTISIRRRNHGLRQYYDRGQQVPRSHHRRAGPLHRLVEQVH